MERDQNLLFGVFAVQLNKVTATQLMEAASAWASNSSKAIPERLLEASALSKTDHDLINHLVSEAIALHGNDAAKTLASFGGETQIHQTYRGSIVLTSDGQVSIPSKGSDSVADEPGDVSSIKGVFETPGRYINSIEHARGGMGRILLVHDDHLGRDIALKELLPHMGVVEPKPKGDKVTSTVLGDHPSPVRFSSHVIARFLQEARITGQLEHPSIVPVYELGHRKDGSLYYTMKLVRGRSLSKAIGDCPSLGERLALLPHFVDLCQAVAYAHSRKIIHRDIKPANVMVGKFGETVVLDWGLAKKRDKVDVHEGHFAETLHSMHLGDEAATAKTKYGQILGTPVYMPPEQARGDIDQVDELSDVYSLGVVLYEIITGKIPFDGKSLKDVLKQVIEGDFIPVMRYAKDAPPELVAITMMAMSAEKDGRYLDVKGLAEEVQRFQSGVLVRAHQYNVSDYTRFIWKRYKPFIATGAVALASLILISGAYTVQLSNSQSSEKEAVVVATRANEQLRQSIEDLTEARDDAVAAKDAEAEERIRAEQARERELEALKKAEETIEGMERASYRANLLRAQGDIGRGEATLAYERLMEAPSSQRNWEWGYLYAEMDESKATFHGHEEDVTGLAFSPDGKYIATWANIGVVKVWSASSGDEIYALGGDADHIYSARFSPDGSKIITALSDNISKVWDALTGEELFTLRGNADINTSAIFSRNGRRILTISRGGRFKVLDADTGNEISGSGNQVYQIVGIDLSGPEFRLLAVYEDGPAKILDTDAAGNVLELVGHTKLASASFNRGGTRVVTVSRAGTVKVWDAKSGKELSSIGGDGDTILRATLNPDGTRVVTVSEEGNVRVWNSDSGSVSVNVMLFSSGGVARYTRKGTHLITVAEGTISETNSSVSTAKLWNAETGAEEFSLNNNFDHFASISPDDSMIIIPSPQSSLFKVWDTSSGSDLFTLRGHADFGNQGYFSPDGAAVATTTIGPTVKIWNSSRGTGLIAPPSDTHEVLAVNVSPHRTQIAISNLDKTIEIYDVDSGGMTLTLAGHTANVTCAAFSTDGARLVTGSDDKLAKVWDVRTGEELITLSGHSDGVYAVSFSRDGTLVITGSKDLSARVWDAKTGKQLLRLFNDNSPDSVAFSPDGSQIVTAPGSPVQGDAAQIWDAQSGAKLFALEGHKSWVPHADFAPDGTRIVTSSIDGTSKIWDAKTGAELLTLSGHSRNVSSASFSPDGRRVVSASPDKTTKLWDANTGDELITLSGHDAGVKRATFTSDGATIVTVFFDNSVQLWKAPPWNDEAWREHTSREELIGLALRHPPAVSRVQIPLLLSSGTHVESLETVSEAWRAHSRSSEPSGIQEIEGQGILFEIKDFLVGLEFEEAREGDLVRRINGQRVNSLVEAAGILEKFADKLRNEPRQRHELDFDVVNRYEHKSYILEFEALK